jgi:hypothetical protein
MATHRKPAASQRGRIFDAMDAAARGESQNGSAGDPAVDCLELEHALYCHAVYNGASYRQNSLRVLHLLEMRRAPTLAFLSTRGSTALVATPATSLLAAPPYAGSDAGRPDARLQRAQALECEERLASYCVRGQVALPDAGTQCARCRSRDIKFEMLQTRSADEPMSIFCTCERCGKRWRM